ncbi:hypothetical protein P3697_05505, partial [Vibrio parahaemolyticus]|nr:hypothetical protein [Vibrio parahaemolyticus]
LNQIAGQEWTTKTSEEKSVSAHEILKRIDDVKVGKGIFAQVFTDKIEKEKLNISVPKYIEDAILWSCSLEKTEEQE